MLDLLAIEFETEAGAEEVRQRLLGMQIMMPVAGAAVGTASGALSGKLTDLGVNNDFMKEVGQTLQSGKVALFLLVRKMTIDKVLPALQGTGGRSLRSSFDETKEEVLRETLAGMRQVQAPAAASPAG